MQIKSQLYKIKGMNKDLSYSIFNPEYSWENKNIRISTRDSNSLLGVTNEKGNLKISVNEYFRDGDTIEYQYAPVFSGFIDALEPPSYTYVPSISNYVDHLEPPTYSYTSLIYGYSDVFEPATYTYIPVIDNYLDALTESI